MIVKVIEAGIGAFLGAFFAFLFMSIRDILASISERQKKYYNALVRLEYLCCENQDNIHINMRLIDDFIEIIQKLKQGERAQYENKLHHLPFPEDILLDFTGIDFINEVLSYKVSLKRFNDDIETFNTMYERYKTAVMRGDITFENYKKILIEVDNLSILKSFLNSLAGKTLKINAYTRILCREQQPLLTRIILLTFKKKIFTDDFNSKVIKEIEEMKKECDEVTARSKRELEEVNRRL